MNSIGRAAPTALDEPMVKGIDGLYENLDPNSDIRYVIDEAKFESAKLKNTKDGLQMSDGRPKGSKMGSGLTRNARNNLGLQPANPTSIAQIAAYQKPISSTKIFKTGDLYESFIQFKGHRVELLAEIEIDGTRLIFKRYCNLFKRRGYSE